MLGRNVMGKPREGLPLPLCDMECWWERHASFYLEVQNRFLQLHRDAHAVDRRKAFARQDFEGGIGGLDGVFLANDRECRFLQKKMARIIRLRLPKIASWGFSFGEIYIYFYSNEILSKDKLVVPCDFPKQRNRKAKSSPTKYQPMNLCNRSLMNTKIDLW